MNEKLHKNIGDCRKIHSTSCLSREKCYTKSVFGCGFSCSHCDFGYVLKYFSEWPIYPAVKKGKDPSKKYAVLQTYKIKI